MPVSEGHTLSVKLDMACKRRPARVRYMSVRDALNRSESTLQSREGQKQQDLANYLVIAGHCKLEASC